MNWYGVADDEVAAFFTNVQPQPEKPNHRPVDPSGHRRASTSGRTNGQTNPTRPSEQIDLIGSESESEPGLVDPLRKGKGRLRGSIDLDLSPPRTSLGRSSDEDQEEAANQLTASQIDRHSLVNLLKSSETLPSPKSDNLVHHQSSNPTNQRDRASGGVDQSTTRSDDYQTIIKRTPRRDRLKNLSSPQSKVINTRTSLKVCEPDDQGSQPKDLNDRPEGESKKTKRTWSMPPRPRDRTHKPTSCLTTVSKTRKNSLSIRNEHQTLDQLCSSPTTSTPTKKRAEETSRLTLQLLEPSSSSRRSSSSQDSTLLPSPLPTWEDHSRGNGLIDFNQSTTDHQGLSRTDEDLSKDLFEDGLGGGRRALSVEILEEPLDLDRLLAPDSMDSNDRSSNSKTDNHQKMSLIEASNILGPSRCIGRSEVEDVGLRGRYPDVEDGWYDVNSPSSKKHEDLNEPSPKQLINQDEMGSENSKRKQLLEELGFEDDSIDNAINQRSSSPIQIINTMNKNNKHYSSNQNEQNEDFDDYDEDGDESIEISFIQDKQTELQQLSEIGIVVTESPTQGITPLMSTWPKAKRDIFLKMAGVRDTPLSSNSRLSKAQEQTEEWDRLLTRQKSSRTSNGANSGDGRRKRKSWNSNNWRFKRGSKRGAAAGGSRSRGGARGRVSSKGVGRVTVVSGSNGRVKRNI